jgi:hypothetical protein
LLAAQRLVKLTLGVDPTKLFFSPFFFFGIKKKFFLSEEKKFGEIDPWL